MRPQNLRLSHENANNNYRQSMSILASQLLRNSFGTDSTSSTNYRESLGLPNRNRYTLNAQLAQHLIRGIENQKKEREKYQFSNLKSTLSELEKKINKAKKQLNTYSNIIGEQESDEERQENPLQFYKTPIKYEDSTTVGSSLSKLAITQSQIDFSSYPNIKTYYLNHLVAALEGKNKRALDHLSMSLKVLRNYYKIQSPTFADLQEKKVNLPRQKADIGKKTLLIDIDQTIIHCQEDSTKPYDIKLPIEVENGSTASAYITIRPYAISFLKRMSKNYELIAFTASHQSYADVVLDQIDPGREYIKHRLYRKNCIQIHENIYAKDLRIVNRDLSSMVLIDNAPYSYIFQLQNGIPILPFYSGEDNELVHLQKYLDEMAKCHDVREFNKKNFKLHKYCNFSQLQDLVRLLYLEQH